MKNYLQAGDIVTVAAPSPGVLSGDFVVVGDLFGVASFDAATGADVEIKRSGVFTLPKTTGATWARGDKLFWDSSTKKFTKTSATNVEYGLAAQVAASGDTTGAVLLNQGIPDAVTGGVAGIASGYRIARGQTTTVTASDTIVTGLTTVVSAIGNLEDAPVLTCSSAQAVIGDQAGAPAAGSIFIKTWMPTSSSVTTPTAATTFSKKVNWIAVGT